jgi:hypothetical protein
MKWASPTPIPPIEAPLSTEKEAIVFAERSALCAFFALDSSVRLRTVRRSRCPYLRTTTSRRCIWMHRDTSMSCSVRNVRQATPATGGSSNPPRNSFYSGRYLRIGLRNATLASPSSELINLSSARSPRRRISAAIFFVQLLDVLKVSIAPCN